MLFRAYIYKGPNKLGYFELESNARRFEIASERNRDLCDRCAADVCTNSNSMPWWNPRNLRYTGIEQLNDGEGRFVDLSFLITGGSREPVNVFEPTRASAMEVARLKVRNRRDSTFLRSCLYVSSTSTSPLQSTFLARHSSLLILSTFTDWCNAKRSLRFCRSSVNVYLRHESAVVFVNR